MSKSESILDKIVATKHDEIVRSKAILSAEQLLARVVDAPPVRDFFAALAAPGVIKLIAEVKKASPSAGVIRNNFDPVEIALAYENHGATCLSCLTDEEYFQGKLDYLSQIREAVSLPVLRKDFIVDTYQVLQSRVAGADAVLLIAECLTDAELKQLYDYIIELKMTPLVEFYAAENCQRVLDVGATLVGVNNRNLHTFETDLQHTMAMQSELPAECLLVAESGIGTPEDVAMLSEQGVDAMLVGESLIRQANIGGAVENLLSLINIK